MNVLIKQDSTAVIPFDKFKLLFLGADGISIKAEFVDGKTTHVAGYKNHTDAKIALTMMAERIAQNQTMVRPPEEHEIKAYIARTHNTITRAADGSKTKRRGGS